LVVGGASGLLLAVDLGKPLFRDEGASLYSAHLSWSGLWSQSKLVDVVLLPYYALLHLWVHLSGGIEWARSLSLLAYVLAIVLVGWLGARVGGLACAVVSSVLVATNPLMVGAALSIRPTALGALAAASTVAALLVWLDRPRKGRLWLFSALLAATAALNLFAALGPMCALVGSLVVWRSLWRARWREAVVPLGLIGVLLGLGAAVGAGQVGQVSWIEAETPMSALKHLLGPADPKLGGYGLFVLVLGVLAIVVIVVANAQRGTALAARPSAHLIMLACWAFGPAAVLVIASLWAPLYQSHYVTAAAPGLALAIGLITSKALGLLGRPRQGTLRVVIGVMVVLAILVVTVPIASRTAASSIEDTKGIARFLDRRATGKGWVILLNHSDTTAISSYWPSEGPRPQLWPQVRQPLIEGLDVDQRAKVLRAAPPVVWVVVDPSTEGGREFVSRLAKFGFEQQQKIRFDGAVVIELRRRDA
jgi:mannosyltransferase